MPSCCARLERLWITRWRRSAWPRASHLVQQLQQDLPLALGQRVQQLALGLQQQRQCLRDELLPDGRDAQ